MKKNILLFIVLLPLFALSQKVSVKDDKIFTDGKEYAMIEKVGCSLSNPTECYFKVKSLSGKLAFLIKWHSFNDPAERRASNPNGSVDYVEYLFMDSKQKAESGEFFVRTNKMAEVIVKNEFFKDGELSKEAVDNFVFINGTKFSERQVAR